ncbi:MAG: DUF493 domain-containing protein [Pseudomonadales bacterium]|nr:DUF493 domain-containing protein [Pseudomonadales bacterium]
MSINEDLWDFPCEIKLKVMGLSQHPLSDILTEIVEKHVTGFDRSTLSTRDSKQGKYISITATVPLTHKSQVEGIYADLDKREEIAWKL